MPNTDALVTVVDSNDRERIKSAQLLLDSFCQEEQLSNSVFVVLANKQDLPDAMSAAEVEDCVVPLQVYQRKYAIFPISGITGEGFTEFLDWLSEKMQEP
eukprot:Hpha_TRINITY_DN5448_c0_g1::TRINITY_DN5448_c0_g1_i2::g.192487::m.192487